MTRFTGAARPVRADRADVEVIAFPQAGEQGVPEFLAEALSSGIKPGKCQF